MCFGEYDRKKIKEVDLMASIIVIERLQKENTTPTENSKNAQRLR